MFEHFLRRKDREKNVFFHIPKTGGYTLNSIIEKQYKKKEIFRIPGDKVFETIDAFKNFSNRKKNFYKIICGHMEFGIHNYLSGKTSYFTFLREPVDRILSYYYYVLRSDDHYLHKKITECNYTIKDCFSNKITLEISNGQSRLLYGPDNEKILFGENPIELFDKVKENIENKFVFIGIQKYFDQGVSILSKKLGWKNINYENLNVTKNRPIKKEIDPETIEIIKENNKIDIKLYEYIEKKFTETAKKYKIEL